MIRTYFPASAWIGGGGRIFLDMHAHGDPCHLDTIAGV